MHQPGPTRRALPVFLDPSGPAVRRRVVPVVGLDARSDLAVLIAVGVAKQ
jgi:hypothetical protein